MLRKLRYQICVPVLLLLFAGCTTIDPESAVYDAVAIAEERTGQRIIWDDGSPDAALIRTEVQSLLDRELTPRDAIQVALINNRQMQALYADVGIAQAAVAQAGRVKNPVLDGAMTWFNDAGGTPNLAFGVAWAFMDLLHRPLREAVAESELEETKLRVAGEVVAHAAKTHIAFIEYVAQRQGIELFEQVVKSTRATVAAARALREAGNITALQFDRQQSELTQAKLMLAQAEARSAAARERLNVLMGLTGSDTHWRAPHRLPEVPGAELATHDAEYRAVANSLDILAARQRLITLGRRFRLVRKTSLFPDFETGVEFEREVEVEEGEEGGTETTFRKALGPTFELEIPIFDRGEARKAGTLLQLLKAEHQLWAVAVAVRSAARLKRAELLTARKTVTYYEEAVLPERSRILAGTQRDYNAMQEDVFRLLVAKRQQILAGRQYIEALRTYWIARTRFMELMNGKLSDDAGGGNVEVAAADGGGDEGGH